MPTTREELIPTRATLLQKLKDLGDDGSWREFFDRYSGLIFSVAMKAGLSSAEADEVVQETVIAVAKKMEHFNYDRNGSFKAWLLNLARWRIRDQYRKRRRLPLADESPAEPREAEPAQIAQLSENAFEATWDAEWRTSLLTAAIEEVKRVVSARQFQIYQLHVLEEWPVERVKKTLGVTAGRIYLAKHRVGHLVKSAVKRLERGML